MKKNRIPRKFNRIIGKMLIDTNVSKAGDVIQIRKDENGYLGLNTRTQKKASFFVSLLRNGEVFELISVE